ncbi:hypothetical protein AVEN_231505-1 [Araneus ventricosus]|uniref:Uncharacterized protein n=1 Tax=Araneus ventricosus TaxID=182803 RepID=A0A4Y2UW83_ARAVE|nr:hypothetical protein AVEN_231505-1 [Araneus ventricosus]
MKRQASIQNFFAKNQSVNRPVSDSAEVDCASNNVSSGVANTSTVDPAPVAEDFKQQIAVRGNRDGGRIGLEEPEKNEGTFRSLLRYRANSGDNDLKDQLMNSGGRRMYTSSFIQNELINTFGHLIQSQIVRNVRESIFHSVLADETTDIQIEQFLFVYANVTSVLDLLSKQRVNANDNFKTLYAQVKEIAAKLDIKEEIPRVCRLQTARNNVPYSTEEEYYRRAVYVPYLDDFCNSLKERSESHKETFASLQHILSEFCTKTDFCSLEAAFNFYEEDLSHKEVVQSEFMLWKEKWRKILKIFPK